MKAYLWIALALAGAGIRPAGIDAQERPRAVSIASRGWMGISLNDLEIKDVAAGSPAAKAGIQRGDLVVRLNGRPATHEAIMALRLAPGDTVRLRTRRGKREQDVTVVAARRMPSVIAMREGGRVIALDVDSLEAMVEDQVRNADVLLRRLDDHLRSDSVRRRLERVIVRTDSLGRRRGGRDTVVVVGPNATVLDVGRRAVAGAEFTDVNPDLGGYFGVSQGVLATRVSPEAPAGRSGLRSGDVITAADGKAIRNVAELRAAVRGAGDRKQLQLNIVRQKARRELTLRW